MTREGSCGGEGIFKKGSGHGWTWGSGAHLEQTDALQQLEEELRDGRGFGPHPVQYFAEQNVLQNIPPCQRVDERSGQWLRVRVCGPGGDGWECGVRRAGRV